MFSTKHTLAALLLLTTACTSPVGKQDSGIDIPGIWSRLTGGDDALVLSTDKAQIEQEWWKHFADPTLNTLVAQALANNKTLAIAKARVEEVRAERVGTRSDLFPQIDGVGSSKRGTRNVYNNNGNDKPQAFSEAGFEASWEFDLFGKNQAHTAAATALLQSEEATAQAVQISLLAELARTYFDFRNLERQVALTEKNLTTQKKTLELTKAQMAGALASDLDVSRASAQVATTQAQIPALEAQRDAALNRLNVLIGAAPGSKDSLVTAEQDMAPLDAKILVSAPARIIAERPDVRAAERSFAASISESDAAFREIFPDISLLSFFGIQNAPGGDNNPWLGMASFSLPILNFGQISSHIDAADARQKQAFLQYQETTLEALEDMENALSSYAHEAVRNQSLHDATTQNRRAAELARAQYANGDTALLDVLVAERNVLDSESNMVASDIQLRKDLVGIYTAAGGGWKPLAEKPAAAAKVDKNAEKPAPAEGAKKATPAKPASKQKH